MAITTALAPGPVKAHRLPVACMHQLMIEFEKRMKVLASKGGPSSVLQPYAS